MFHYLPNYAWANENLAGLAGQPGKVSEHPDQSTQPTSMTTSPTLYIGSVDQSNRECVRFLDATEM